MKLTLISFSPTGWIDEGGAVTLLTIDGAHGEGGGQILRTSLSLSCILQRGCNIVRIRAGRKKPGLLPQHLASVLSAQKVSDADVKGNEFGSSSLVFQPRALREGRYLFDVARERGSAGSVSLVLSTLLPPLVYAPGPSHITVKGGTHVPFSPSFQFVDEVLLDLLLRMGVQAEVQLVRYGYYPMGGGEVRLRVEPSRELTGLHLTDKGTLKAIRGVSAVSNLPRSVAERQRQQALHRLQEKGMDVEIEVRSESARGKGTFFFLAADFDGLLCGFSALGAKGKRAEQVADEAVEALFHHTARPGAIDPHLADQILIYAVLARGRTVFTTSKVTHHMMTNAWVIEQFLGTRVKVEGELGAPGRVEVEGVGHRSG
jgi:RNA 3'-terminal phosphate cyclase (ATP)